MQTLAHFYESLFPWVAFSPIIVVIVAVNVTVRMSKYKWIGHTLTYAALVLTLPIYVFILGIMDPTTIEYPGPGDGFVFLLYLFFLVPAILLYSAYAWVTRRKSRVVRPAS